MPEDRIIEGIIVPEDLVHPGAVRTYVKIMKRFSDENSRVSAGIMGSYCASGQEYFAHTSAMNIQSPPPIREITDVKSFLDNCLKIG